MLRNYRSNMHNVEPENEYLDPRIGLLLEWTQEAADYRACGITDPSTKRKLGR